MKRLEKFAELLAPPEPAAGFASEMGGGTPVARGAP